MFFAIFPGWWRSIFSDLFPKAWNGLAAVNDIVINKISSIQRCIKRAREEFNGAGDFKNDLTAQDARGRRSRSC